MLFVRSSLIDWRASDSSTCSWLTDRPARTGWYIRNTSMVNEAARVDGVSGERAPPLPTRSKVLQHPKE
eukprot:2538482-Rhodomonas_salina.1